MTRWYDIIQDNCRLRVYFSDNPDTSYSGYDRLADEVTGYAFDRALRLQVNESVEEKDYIIKRIK